MPETGDNFQMVLYLPQIMALAFKQCPCKCQAKLFFNFTSGSPQKSFLIQEVLDLHSLVASIPASISALSCEDIVYTETALTFTLKWIVHNSNCSDPVDHCNVYTRHIFGDTYDENSWKSDYVFLGRAYNNCFKVIDLYILSNTTGTEGGSTVELIVQPVTQMRWKLSIEESPNLAVRITP
ncbi:hypothetical protein EMCRGX_G033569 [Ephydatia muelleri]|eukprot:Em0022g685a